MTDEIKDKNIINNADNEDIQDSEEDEEKLKENQTIASSNSMLDMATEVANRLNEKVKSLKDMEVLIDNKIKKFHEFVKSTELEGKSFAGQPEETTDQKLIKSVKSILEGTGLNPFD